MSRSLDRRANNLMSARIHILQQLIGMIVSIMFQILKHPDHSQQYTKNSNSRSNEEVIVITVRVRT